MNSISGKKWLESKIHTNILEKIKQDFNFSEIISKIIISRNFDEKELSKLNICDMDFIHPLIVKKIVDTNLKYSI